MQLKPGLLFALQLRLGILSTIAQKNQANVWPAKRLSGERVNAKTAARVISPDQNIRRLAICASALSLLKKRGALYATVSPDLNSLV